jgi:hypothetical protein
MAHYYFDVRDGGDLSIDDLGMELRDIEVVQLEANAIPGDMARDAIRSPEYDASQTRRVAIEVRDGSGPVLHARFTVELERPS